MAAHRRFPPSEGFRIISRYFHGRVTGRKGKGVSLEGGTGLFFSLSPCRRSIMEGQGRQKGRGRGADMVGGKRHNWKSEIDLGGSPLLHLFARISGGERGRIFGFLWVSFGECSFEGER